MFVFVCVCVWWWCVVFIYKFSEVPHDSVTISINSEWSFFNTRKCMKCKSLQVDSSDFFRTRKLDTSGSSTHLLDYIIIIRILPKAAGSLRQVYPSPSVHPFPVSKVSFKLVLCFGMLSVNACTKLDMVSLQA